MVWGKRLLADVTCFGLGVSTDRPREVYEPSRFCPSGRLVLGFLRNIVSISFTRKP